MAFFFFWHPEFSNIVILKKVLLFLKKNILLHIRRGSFLKVIFLVQEQILNFFVFFLYFFILKTVQRKGFLWLIKIIKFFKSG